MLTSSILSLNDHKQCTMRVPRVSQVAIKGNLKRFPQMIFAVFDCIYVIFLLFLYFSITFPLLSRMKTSLYTNIMDLFTTNFLEYAWCTRYDIIVLTLFSCAFKIVFRNQEAAFFCFALSTFLFHPCMIFTKR